MAIYSGAALQFGGISSWDALTGYELNPDTVAPTVTGAAANNAEIEGVLYGLVTLQLSEPCQEGDVGGFSVFSSGSSIGILIASVTGDQIFIVLDRIIYDNEIITIGYTQPGDGVQDTSGSLLESFEDFAVTNNSEEPGPDLELPRPFDLGGAITNAKALSVQKARAFVLSSPTPGATYPITTTNGQYSLDGGALTSAPGSVTVGQTVEFYVTASALPYAAVVGTLNIGGEDSDFIVVTGAVGAADAGIAFYVRDPETKALIVDTTINIEIRTAQFGGSTLYEAQDVAIDSTGFLVVPLEGGELGNQVYITGLLADGRYIAGVAGILDIAGL